MNDHVVTVFTKDELAALCTVIVAANNVEIPEHLVLAESIDELDYRSAMGVLANAMAKARPEAIDDGLRDKLAVANATLDQDRAEREAA